MEEYFDSKVIGKEVEHKKVRKSAGFLSFEMVDEKSFYLKCKIEGLSRSINIKVSKEEFELAKEGDKVSLMLKFKYKFSCLHFVPNHSNEKKGFYVK